jgi:GntR family transcriptional repressor for pyruvate dehydrogenase complex
MGQPIAIQPMERISSKSLVRQVVERLGEFILAHSRQDQRALPSQGELTKMLGVSRTVLREAMKLLEARGLVTISQGRRPQVRPAGPQAAIESLDALLERTDGTLLQLVEVRRPLEGEIAALAAERMDDLHFTRAESAVVDLQAATTLEQQVAADLRFHRILAEATGNPVFGVILDTIAGLLKASRVHTIGTYGARAAIEGHQAILAALRRRDPKAAREAMLHHFDWNERQIRKGKP